MLWSFFTRFFYLFFFSPLFVYLLGSVGGRIILFIRWPVLRAPTAIGYALQTLTAPLTADKFPKTIRTQRQADTKLEFECRARREGKLGIFI